MLSRPSRSMDQDGHECVNVFAWCPVMDSCPIWSAFLPRTQTQCLQIQDKVVIGWQNQHNSWIKLWIWTTTLKKNHQSCYAWYTHTWLYLMRYWVSYVYARTFLGSLYSHSLRVSWPFSYKGTRLYPVCAEDMLIALLLLLIFLPCQLLLQWLSALLHPTQELQARHTKRRGIFSRLAVLPRHTIARSGCRAKHIGVGLGVSDLLEQADHLLPDSRWLAVRVVGQEVADQFHFLYRESLSAAMALAHQSQRVHTHLLQHTKYIGSNMTFRQLLDSL